MCFRTPLQVPCFIGPGGLIFVCKICLHVLTCFPYLFQFDKFNFELKYNNYLSLDLRASCFFLTKPMLYARVSQQNSWGDFWLAKRRSGTHAVLWLILINSGWNKRFTFTRYLNSCPCMVRRHLVCDLLAFYQTSLEAIILFYSLYFIDILFNVLPPVLRAIIRRF